MNNPSVQVIRFSGVLAVLLSRSILAAVPDAAELVRMTENPLANLVSVPLQNTWDFGNGPRDATTCTLKLQPIIPFALGPRWHLITRTIIPFSHSAADSADGHGITGLGDTCASLFLSPTYAGPNGWFWGLGPALLVPTATDDGLGHEQWGMGPTFAVGRQQQGWSGYLLSRHVWSLAGAADHAAVCETLVQPSLSYALESRGTLGLNSESKYDWPSGHWTVPLILSVSHLLNVGHVPVKLALGALSYVERPAGGPDWGLRFTMTFLFPE